MALVDRGAASEPLHSTCQNTEHELEFETPFVASTPHTSQGFLFTIHFLLKYLNFSIVAPLLCNTISPRLRPCLTL